MALTLRWLRSARPHELRQGSDVSPDRRAPRAGLTRHVPRIVDLRFHDLRHTGAVFAASTGATLAELMARLGHSTLGAALRHQHAAEERDRVIADALSQLVIATSPRKRAGLAGGAATGGRG